MVARVLIVPEPVGANCVRVGEFIADPPVGGCKPQSPSSNHWFDRELGQNFRYVRSTLRVVRLDVGKGYGRNDSALAKRNSRQSDTRYGGYSFHDQYFSLFQKLRVNVRKAPVLKLLCPLLEIVLIDDG